MLFEVKKYYLDGVVHHYITDKEPSFKVKGTGIHSIGVKRFKYHYTHSLIPPVIALMNGKKVIPGVNLPIHPGTTLDDIIWIKPSKEQKQTEKQLNRTWEFKSSTSDIIYKVILNMNKLKCDCPGFWRAKGKCKHVKEVEKELEKN